jgi:hypothetical protein
MMKDTNLRWNIKHLAILIALLAVGFGVFGVAGTFLVAAIFSPVLLTARGQRRAGFYRMFTYYPFCLLLGLYLTWFAAWAVLGRIPRCIADDPKDINGIELPLVLTSMVLFTSPFAFVIGSFETIFLVVDPSRSKLQWFRRSYPLFLFPIVWGVGYGLLYWDPLNVLEWFVD